MTRHGCLSRVWTFQFSADSFEKELLVERLLDVRAALKRQEKKEK